MHSNTYWEGPGSTQAFIKIMTKTLLQYKPVIFFSFVAPCSLFTEGNAINIAPYVVK